MLSPSASLRVGGSVALLGGVLVLVGYVLPVAYVTYMPERVIKPFNNDDLLLALAALVVVITSAVAVWRLKWSPRLAALCLSGALVGLFTHLFWTSFTFFSGWGMNFYQSHPTHLAAGFWSQLAGCILMTGGALFLVFFTVVSSSRAMGGRGDL